MGHTLTFSKATAYQTHGDSWDCVGVRVLAESHVEHNTGKYLVDTFRWSERKDEGVFFPLELLGPYRLQRQPLVEDEERVCGWTQRHHAVCVTRAR